MPRTTRREALVTLAAAGAAMSPVSAASDYRPKALSSSRYQLLSVAVDRILPASETPGAAEAGVPQILDQVAQRDRELQLALEGVADALAREDFGGQNAAGQDKILTAWMNGAPEDRDRFQLLKDWAIDAYYSTQVGLVDELGYRGNSYLADFPGCQHEGRHEERG